MTDHLGLPVQGYRPQTDEAVGLVNGHKLLEEQCLQVLDKLSGRSDIDKRWLAIGRTDMEKAWMAINRAVFQPERAKLP
jgi:hypothetical protein